MRKAIWVGIVGALSVGAWFGTRTSAHREHRREPIPPATVMDVVPMRAEDGNEYLVAPGETLADAMAGAVARFERLEAYVDATSGSHVVFHQDGTISVVLGQDDPGSAEGHCYNDGLDPDKVPPEGKAACACYKTTKCDPNSGEMRTCKRYCRKDKCDCCAI